MIVNRRHFPKIMQDNDEVFLQHLIGILSSVDELCSVEIIKAPTGYKFRIAPSVPKYMPLLIEEILKFHNRFKMRLDMSKSIKTSGSIVFEILI